MRGGACGDANEEIVQGESMVVVMGDKDKHQIIGLVPFLTPFPDSFPATANFVAFKHL